jgi:CRISPR/Cas system-associated exonuclease Cas4 (RecB family)
MKMNDLQVKCLAGKGVVTAQECLDCSLRAGHPECEYDYGLLAALLKNEPRPEIHVTDLTDCLRRAWYAKKEPRPGWVHDRLAAYIGTLFHSSVEITNDATRSEVPLSYGGVVGTADRVYANGRVVDYKTTKYIYLDRLPYGSHSLQINLYAHMLRKMGHKVTSLAIQYIATTGPTTCTGRKGMKHAAMTLERVNGVLMCPHCGSVPRNGHQGVALVEVPMMPEYQIEAVFNERRDALQKALESGEPPEAEPSWLCAYCRVIDRCSKGEIYLNGYGDYENG